MRLDCQEKYINGLDSSLQGPWDLKGRRNKEHDRAEG